MTKNLDDIGLKSVADHYDLFFVDLWGVVHNGIELYKDSINALEKLLEKNKDLVLLTNAPRPNNDVKNFLKKMGLEEKYYSKVYTSGEAALNYLTLNFKDKTFFHIGPPRDFGLFNDFKNNNNKSLVIFAMTTITMMNVRKNLPLAILVGLTISNFVSGCGGIIENLSTTKLFSKAYIGDV